MWTESKAGAWRSQNITLAVAWPLCMAGVLEECEVRTKPKRPQADDALASNSMGQCQPSSGEVTAAPS